MIGEYVEGRARGFQEILGLQFAGRRHSAEDTAFAGGPGAEKQAARRGFAEKAPEGLDVAAICGSAVTPDCAALRRVVGFVHELGRSDVAASRFGIGEDVPGLIGSPGSSGIAIPRPKGERGDEPSFHGMDKIDHAFPLLPGQDGVETGGRLLGSGIVGVVKENSVRPGSTDPDVSGSESQREFAQAGVGQVNGRAVFEKAGGQPGARAVRLGGGRQGSGGVGFPKASAGASTISMLYDWKRWSIAPVRGIVRGATATGWAPVRTAANRSRTTPVLIM